jgi:hypothetical protein
MTTLRSGTLLLLSLPSLFGGQPARSDQSFGSKIWVDRYQEIEDYLRTSECWKMEALGANRAARCTLRPGGPVARMAWRPGPPGVYRGFRVSYKAEIAAYELDKLLKMDMVPPSVERRLEGNVGAAQLWVENVVPLEAGVLPDEPMRARWESQLTRMAMFDSLIGNADRNMANLLRDDTWNAILIDHSGAFPANADVPRNLRRIDQAFWGRIAALTRAQLDEALGPWLSRDELTALLNRREKMKAQIESIPK